MSWRRIRHGRKPVEAPPAPTVEQQVLAASQACDEAARALGVALAARRAALVKLAARTIPPGSSVLLRMFAAPSSWACLSFHNVGQFCGMPVVSSRHRRSFTEVAQAAINSSSASRRPPPAPKQIEESQDAQAV
jgi:hypothetical protein